MDNHTISLPIKNDDHIQPAPPYHCPHCGAPIYEILQYDHCHTSTSKPLDTFGHHLQYLNCHACHQRQQVARLGDAILPFDWPPSATAKEKARYIAHLLQRIAREVEPQGSNSGSATSIVYRLLAGTLAPESAIHGIRELVHDGILGALDVQEPEFIFQKGYARILN
ncbi:MAG: hypothetical protein GY832_26390 [Chloroflexi bacterium]|nr:hypothetical protein [Chloroflexota bacterium]